MSIDATHLTKYLIVPTLIEMNELLPGAYSENAVAIMLGILAQESEMGTYLHQRGVSASKGAKGIYQIESATHMSIWNHYLKYHQELALWVKGKASQHALDDVDYLWYDGDDVETWSDLQNNPTLDTNLVTNLTYGTIIARLILWIDSEPLPSYRDIEGMAKYYKRVYNTPEGKATEQQFVDNYNRFYL